MKIIFTKERLKNYLYLCLHNLKFFYDFCDQFIKSNFLIFPKKKGNIFVSWLLSYILILLLPIIISSFIYTKSVNIVTNEINLTNKALLKQVQQTLDNQFQNVMKFGWQINQNPRLQTAMYSKSDLDADQRYLFYQISEDLKNYQALNSSIESSYIYIKNKDIVISCISYDNTRNFYKLNHSDEKITYEEWYNLINNCKKIQYVPLESISDENSDSNLPHKSIAYLQPIPIGSNNDPSATLVILIDEQKIRKALQEINLVKKGDLYIIDENSTLMSTTSELQTLPKEINYNVLKNDDETLHLPINSSEMTLSCITSRFLKWKYISVIPKNIFMEKVSYIRKFSLISTFICLFLGITIAYIFSKKNYDPVNKLMNKLTKIIGIDNSKIKNEFNYIEATIDSTLNEKKLISDKLLQQNKVLKYNFLSRLIKGRVDTSIPINESLVSFDISFNKDLFSIMIFYIEDFEEFFCKDTDKNKAIDEKLNLVEFIFSNVVEDIVGKEHQVFVVEVDNTLCCLLNFNSPNQDEAKTELLKIAREAQNFIQDRLHIYFSAAIGDVHKDISTINIAYQEALEAMEYKMVIGYSTIISYNSIKVTGNKYKYSLETEQQLINFIKAGEFKNAEAIINKIFNENFSNNYLSVEMTKCLIFDIASTLVKTISEVSNNREVPFLEKLYPIERLTKCKTIIDMKTELINILESTCNYVNKNKKKHNIVLRDQIIEYVNNNYNYVELDVSMLADKFNLNQSYLSTFFKESSGVGLLDYINRVRIENAKTFLKERNTSIADIATKVGYYNSNTFIRTFKKYEGITPGKYKEMN